jgi:drug/metabolite transporter (DMT)-like permease
MSPKLRGILYTVGSAASLSVTFIASKQAMAELTPLAFAPLWFAIASLWGLGYYFFQPAKIPLSKLRLNWKPLLLIGLSGSIGNFFFFTAISMGDPTVVAFFARATTIFALLMGVVWLRERMTPLQWAGGLVALTGAGLMTYQGGNLIWAVLAISLLTSFFHALTSYIAKRNVSRIEPAVLNIARTGGAAIFIGAIALLLGDLTRPSLEAVLWMVGGAFFGPFLSYILFYKGMATLEIGQAAIIRASQPLFVALYSFVLFGSLITGRQFIGGMVILLGIVFILWPRGRIRRPEANAVLSKFRSSLPPKLVPPLTSVARGNTENVVSGQD